MLRVFIHTNPTHSAGMKEEVSRSCPHRPSRVLCTLHQRVCVQGDLWVIAMTPLVLRTQHKNLDKGSDSGRFTLRTSVPSPLGLPSLVCWFTRRGSTVPEELFVSSSFSLLLRLDSLQVCGSFLLSVQVCCCSLLVNLAFQTVCF